MKKHVKNAQIFLKQHPKSLFLIHIALLLLVWLFMISPVFNAALTSKEEKNVLHIEISMLEKLSREISSLSKTITLQPRKSNDSVLKQVEELAQNNGVFARIKRLTPTQKSIGGQKRKGLTLVLEKTSLKELTPFLYAISHKSVLDIHDISLRRGDDDTTTEGQINVQLTLLGGI